MTTSPDPRGAHSWSAFGASVRGAAHVRESLPNQDAQGCLLDYGGRFAATAVADGHGHSLAVRADAGSRLAVEVALASAQACWGGMGGNVERFDGAAVAASLPGVIATTWMNGVESDLERAPLSELELERSGNAELLGTHPESAYGSTLLAVLAVGSTVVVCQVGDGDLLGVTAGGKVLRLLPPDERLVGTKTTSLASRSAAADFRSTHVDVDATGLHVVVAATDGYVNSFSADDGFAMAGRDLWKLLHEVGPASVSQALASWLESTSTDGTGDDATLALLFDDAALGSRPRPGSGSGGTPADATLTISEGSAS